MKKLSKLLALFLSIAMLMTMLAIPAFAADDDEEGGANTEGGEAGSAAVATTSTIDTTLKGSITINKYEGNDKSTPLAGVEFTIYKIATIEQSATSPIGVTLTPIDALQGKITIDGDTTYADVQDAVEAAIEAGTLVPAKEPAETVLNGNVASVTFSDLDLGVYVVVETNAPTQIVERSANFLVSVPMTSADGTQWEYDVVAEPKNEAVRGGVKLKKTGKTAADQDESALAGAIFELYMQTGVDADNNPVWAKVETDSAGNPITKQMLTTSDRGLIEIEGLAPGNYYFKEIQVPNGSGYILDDVTCYYFQIGTDGKPVYPKETTTVRIGENDRGEAILAIKVVNEKPDMNKEVLTKNVDKDGKPIWGNATDAARGETVTYRLTVDVPQGIANLLDFTLTDTMVNQTFVANSLQVLKANDETVIYTQEALGDAFDLDGKTWTIEFNDHAVEDGKVTDITTLLGNYAGQQIIVMFDATLDDSAIVAPGRNDNDATLEYTNEWTYEGQPVPPLPSNDRIKDEVTVYTFQIRIVKTDGNNNNLAGAEFDLYEKITVAEGEEAPEGAVQNPVAGLTGTYKKINTTSLVTDANGKITVEGLDNGDYWLVETKAPEDYNLLKEPVKVTLAVQYTVTTETTTTYDKDGKVTSKVTTITEETFDGEIEEGVYGQSTTVVNRKGFELPQTGGMGTILFSVIGGMLILCGAAIIFRSKKIA